MPTILSNIKIYHIIHIDRFKSILSEGYLYCDSIMSQKPNLESTSIGMHKIKQRRLTNYLKSYPNLTVGQFVPFYFCPRSVMLYVINCKNNQELSYKGGQENIIHLVFDLNKVLDWAKTKGLRSCYTTSNAGSCYFEDFSDFSQITNMIDWGSVKAIDWHQETIKEGKQSEFLIENRISTKLIEYIGVYDSNVCIQVNNILNNFGMSQIAEQRSDWYY